MFRTLLLTCILACAAWAACAGPVENILLITYDGLRYQEVFGGVDARLLEPQASVVKNADALKERFWADTPEARRERLLPFLWKTVVPHGQLYGDAEKGSPVTVTNARNFSYPGYNELLTGAGDPRIDSNAKKNNPNTTVLEWLNTQPAYADKVFAFGSWDVFPYIINAERSGVPVNAGWEGIASMPGKGRLALVKEAAAETPHVWSSVRYDWFTYEAAAACIRDKSPRVLYISFGETDDWAHDKRYDLYLDAAQRTDAYIERLWRLVQSLPQYAGKTALLLATDHGRGDTVSDWTSHGSDIPGCNRIWFAAMGPGIAPAGVVTGAPATQSQFAPTAAALLGEGFAPPGQTVASPLPCAEKE